MYQNRAFFFIANFFFFKSDIKIKIFDEKKIIEKLWCFDTEWTWLIYQCTGWERAVRVSLCATLYSGRIFSIMLGIDYFCVLK